jgi:hypothetical protein
MENEKTANKAPRYRMPFGKHTGKLISQIPVAYLRWLSTLRDIPDPLKIAVYERIGGKASDVLLDWIDRHHEQQETALPADENYEPTAAEIEFLKQVNFENLS